MVTLAGGTLERPIPFLSTSRAFLLCEFYISNILFLFDLRGS
jgi:hypothetical protein